MPIETRVPQALTSRDRWCTWDIVTPPNGKPTKKPDQSTRDLTVCRAWNDVKGKARVGFVMTGGVTYDGYRLLCLDIDACFARAHLTDWAAELVSLLENDAWFELSPSGRGLHAWFWVPEELVHEVRGVTYLDEEAVDGKRPQIQVFGLGPAQYVTVTGNSFAGSSDTPRELPRDVWAALLDEFGMRAEREHASKNLPKGYGEPPAMAEIEHKILDLPFGPDLVHADWEKVVDGREFEDRSASAAFWLLAVETLRAARGHVAEAVEFILTRTDWDKVERSMNPHRYVSRRWVEGELKRAWQKTNVGRDPAAAFEAVDVGPKKQKPDPWEITAFADARNAKQAVWAIKGYARAGQIGFLAAAPAVGKSTLAVAWAVAAAWATDWCGNRVRAGNVLALVGEDKQGFVRRVQAAAKQRELPELPVHRLDIVSFKLALSTEQGQRELARLVAEHTAQHGNPTLILVDTLSAHWAETEDSSEFAAPFMRALEGIADRTDAVVAVMHHVTKARGRTSMPELGDMRGSGAFGGSSDFIVGLCCGQDRTEVLVEGVKNKTDPAAPRARLKLHKVELGHDDEGDEITAGVLGQEMEVLSDEEREESERDRVGELVQALLDRDPTLPPLTSKKSLRTVIRGASAKKDAAIEEAIAGGFIAAPEGGGYAATERGRERVAPPEMPAVDEEWMT